MVVVRVHHGCGRPTPPVPLSLGRSLTLPLTGTMGGVRTARRPGTRSVLAQRGYRRLWAARTVSQAGDVLQFTAMALLVYRLTGRGLGLSGLVLAEIVPVLLLVPLAGPLVDRMPRVGVMVAADLARAVLAGILALWHGDVAVVYALAMGLSAGSAFFNPAAGALLPALVADDELLAANSGIWSAAVLVQIGVAPAAAVLAVAVGFSWAFALNAVSFVLSALVLRGLRTVRTSAPAGGGHLFAEGAQALGLLVRDRLLRSLALAQALAALSAGATSALLVVLAARRLHAAGSGYGLLLAAIGVGAFAGPLLLTRLGEVARGPRVLCGAFGLRALVDLVLASVTSLPAAATALLFYGLGTSTGNVTFSSLLQTHVPEQLRGRVFAAFDFIWQAMRLASLLLGGVLADLVGIQAVFVTGALLLAAAALASAGAAGVPAPAQPSGGSQAGGRPDGCTGRSAKR